MESTTTLIRQDDDLIAAVANGRDRNAFVVLYQRYENDAFNLALHITGKRHLAEEAVQQAMWDVWRSAHRYKPGCFRTWVLRIVANASLKNLRGLRNRKEKALEHLPEHSVEDCSPVGDVERTEVLQALRVSMARLSQVDRRLLSLYFSVGMSQREIGRELAMPTRTVSFKIDEAVRQLRGMLEAAGFAGVLPLVTAEAYGNALCAQVRAPATLGEGVLGRIRQPSFRTKPHVRPKPKGLFASAAAVVTTIVVVAVSLQAPPRPAPNPSRTVQDPPLTAYDSPMTKVSSAAQPVEVRQNDSWMPLPAQWDFAKGPASNLELFQASWTWRMVGGAGAMDSNLPDANVCVGVALPRFQPNTPLAITVVVEQPKEWSERLGIDALWIKKLRAVRHVCKGCFVPIYKPLNTYQIYIFDRYMVLYLSGIPLKVAEFDEPYPGDRVGLLVKLWLVRSISVRELTPEEMGRIKLTDLLEGFKKGDKPYTLEKTAQSLLIRAPSAPAP